MDTNPTFSHRPPAAAASKARILVVDDVRENRDILKRGFERQGFHGTEAGSGIEAMALLERETFDLVLLDMMMPDMSGLEVLTRIRATHSAGALPVIMGSPPGRKARTSSRR